MKWLDKIGRFLLKKNKQYMIKYVIDNISLVSVDILYKIQIDMIVDNTNRKINLNQLYKKLIKIKTIIDETNTYIPLEHSIYPVRSDTYKLLDLVTDSNNTIPSDYQTTIVDTIHMYNTLLTIFKEKEILKDDLDYEHNSKIIDLYIITMDSIIQILFNTISE